MRGDQFRRHKGQRVRQKAIENRLLVLEMLSEAADNGEQAPTQDMMGKILKRKTGKGSPGMAADYVSDLVRDGRIVRQRQRGRYCYLISATGLATIMPGVCAPAPGEEEDRARPEPSLPVFKCLRKIDRTLARIVREESGMRGGVGE